MQIEYSKEKRWKYIFGAVQLKGPFNSILDPQ